MKSFSIVGAGRLGTVLGAALARRGWRVEAIADRDMRAARESRRIIGAGRATTSLAGAAKAKGTVVIAVPDSAVAGVARILARSGGSWSGRSVFHTSGLLPAQALGPLEARGARVASLHPVQSFPRKDLPDSVFRGITWGIEGGPEAIREAVVIVKSLRGHVLLLTARDKALYHAASALASNAFVALEGTAVEVLKKAGVDADAAVRTLLPLVQGTLQNVKSLGLEKALTGPILRGDVETVSRHLAALRDLPETRRVYEVLGKQVLDLAASNRALPSGRIRALKRLLAGR